MRVFFTNFFSLSSHKSRAIEFTGMGVSVKQKEEEDDDDESDESDESDYDDDDDDKDDEFG
jgi:hypothetical protein